MKLGKLGYNGVKWMMAQDPGRFKHVATTSTLTWWCDFEQSHGKFPDSATLP